MYGEAYFCDRCLTEIGTWRPDYDSHPETCPWLRQPFKRDPRLGGYQGMQRYLDWLAGRKAAGLYWHGEEETVPGAGTPPPEPTAAVRAEGGS